MFKHLSRIRTQDHTRDYLKYIGSDVFKIQKRYKPACCRKKLVIDHDGGADDAMAIAMALLYEKYFNGPCVVGLTTVFGNVNLSQVLINTQRILDVCDRRDVQIYSGAESPLIKGIEQDHFFGFDGLGDDGYQPNRPLEIGCLHSAEALIELSKKYQDDLIVAAIGPATNIALAIRLDPCFVDRLFHLYLGGGHIYSAKHPDAEFNVAMDPEAYYVVSDVGNVNKMTVMPYSQVLESMAIEKKWRKDILGSIQTPIVQALNCYERVSLDNAKDWAILDPAVIAIILNPKVIQSHTTAKVSVCLCGNRGKTEFDFKSPKPNSRVFCKGNVEVYKKFLIEVFCANLDT